MDPVVQEVFEEYLRSNPDLQDHVECLRSTRLLLCSYACGCHAPNDLHDRLRRQISCELMKSRVPFQIVLADRLRSVATLASAMALLVLLGMAAGVTLLDDDPEEISISAADAVDAGEKGRMRYSLRPYSAPSEQPFYPSYSAFTPLSTVRSLLVATERRGRDYGSDSTEAAIQIVDAAP